MNNRITNKYYVEFEGRWNPWEGFRKTCELPHEMDFKELGRFLKERFGEEGFHITHYYMYRQRMYTHEDGEILSGERKEKSSLYCLYNGHYPVEYRVLNKLREIQRDPV